MAYRASTSPFRPSRTPRIETRRPSIIHRPSPVLRYCAHADRLPLQRPTSRRVLPFHLQQLSLESHDGRRIPRATANNVLVKIKERCRRVRVRLPSGIPVRSLSIHFQFLVVVWLSRPSSSGTPNPLHQTSRTAPDGHKGERLTLCQPEEPIVQSIPGGHKSW